MLKKFLSRRGFTIVEVMVAFVIFSIMAAMVATILNATMRTKQQNIVIEDEIAEQKSKYYLNTQDMEYKDKSTDGSIDLDFSATGGGKVSIDYSIGNPNKPEDNNQVELDYYIGHLNYNPSGSGDGKGDDGGPGSVTERLDSRIYGTSGIDEIDVKVKALGNIKGGYTYIFEVLPMSSILVGSQYEYHAQFKMKFPSTIVDYGYVDLVSRDPGEAQLQAKTEGYNKGINLANVSNSVGSSNVICIGSRMSDAKQGKPSMFGNSSYKKFWVTLSSSIDTSDLNQIFGVSASDETTTKSGDVYTFKPYRETVKDEDGNVDEEGTITHPNIFGAFPNEDDEPETPADTGESTSEA